MGEAEAALRQEEVWREMRRQQQLEAKQAEVTREMRTRQKQAVAMQASTATWTEEEFEKEFGVKVALPEKALITKVDVTKEGYQIEYMLPAPSPVRPPDLLEWIGQRWEQITHPKPFSVVTTPKGKVAYVKYTPIMGPPKKPITPTLIRTVEDIQKSLREMPGEPTFRVTPTGFKYEKLGETLAEQLELTMIPIGMVRTVEATLGRQPSVLGAGVGTLISPLPGAQVGPLWVGGKGAFTTAPLTQYWEETKEHPLLVPGEVVGEILLAKYIWGPAMGEAWKGAKWVGAKSKKAFMKLAFPGRLEKALYERVVLAPQIAKEVFPEEEAFRVFTKTAKGWEYKTLRTTEKLTRETAKKTAWKPLLWKKAKVFKPKQYPWLPPQPLKVVREIPRIVSAEKGMALLTKQVTRQFAKQVPRLTAKQVAKTLAKQTLPLTVPHLVKWTGKPYPSKYAIKRKKKPLTLPRYPYEKPLRLPQYPTIEKEARKIVVPKMSDLLKTSPLVSEAQLEKQLLKQSEKQTTVLSQSQLIKQLQLQEQARPRKLRLREERIRKRKKRRWGGKWYFKLHPVATPQEMMKRLAGLKGGV